MFRLPLTLTCVAIEQPAPTGGPLILDCVVHDAEGVEVHARGHMRINVNAKSSSEEISSILQSHANSAARDMLARGQAERVELADEDRFEDMELVVGKTFMGVAK